LSSFVQEYGDDEYDDSTNDGCDDDTSQFARDYCWPAISNLNIGDRLLCTYFDFPLLYFPVVTVWLMIFVITLLLSSTLVFVPEILLVVLAICQRL
jgi:hypothetical protein